MATPIVRPLLGRRHRDVLGMRCYSAITLRSCTTGGPTTDCHIKRGDSWTCRDEFRGFEDCPASRPTLQLLRRGRGTEQIHPPPAWIFAHEIKNFKELQQLQQQVSRDTDASESAVSSTPEWLRPLAVNIVDDEDGTALGIGLFHSRPLIAARVLEGAAPSRPLNTDFFCEKLLDAASRRRGLPAEALWPRAPLAPLVEQPEPETDVPPQRVVQPGTLGSVSAGFYRLIHGENDGLPGLVVECFGSVVVIQQMTRGSELLTEPLLSAIEKLVRPSAVVLRNDSLQRELERDPFMKRYAAVVSGKLEKWQWVQEGGSIFPVDILSSPDTGKSNNSAHFMSILLTRNYLVELGWYYDRRDVRQAVARLARGARVLDLHCHSAAFSVAAIRRGGARSAVCVDTSSLSLQLAAAAAEANKVKEQVLLQQADALQWLRSQVHKPALSNNDAAPLASVTVGAEDRMSDSGHSESQFDLIILDPPPPHRRGLVPAFIDDLRQLATAAASITNKGGRLVVVDSSRFLQLQQLLRALSTAVATSGRTVATDYTKRGMPCGFYVVTYAAVLEMHGGPTLDCPRDLRSQAALGTNWVVLQLD